MSNNWSEKKLGEFVTIEHGFAFKGEFFSDEPPGDILVTPGNFRVGGGFKNDKPKYYRGSVPENYVLSPGDLIVTMTDLSKEGDTLGYPAIVPDVPGVRFLHNQRIGKVLRRPSADIDFKFLFYRLCARDYRHEVLASATGTTVKHTSPARITAFVSFALTIPTSSARLRACWARWTIRLS
jgi:type I restriction enzyme, S subunit